MENKGGISTKGRLLYSFLPLLLVLLVIISGRSKEAEKPKEEKTVERIVCLSPASTEICFAVGAKDKIVAVTSYCDYPPEVKNMPVVGGFDGSSISIEAILSYKPDLVYLTDGMHNFLIPQLDELGIKYYLSNSNSIKAVLAEILEIGLLTGNEDTAKAVVEKIQQQLNTAKGVAGMGPAAGVAEKTAAEGEDFGAQGAAPLSKKSVYWEIWNAPYMSAGKQSFINDVILAAGGVNIFGDLEEAYPVISEEALIARAPEYILIPASSGVSAGDVAKRSGWEKIPAVINGRIFVVDDNLYTRPAARIGDAVEELSKLLNEAEK